MSSARWAHGTELQRGDGAGSEAFTAVAEVTTLTGPNFTRETIDVTNHSSANGHREHLGSLKDSGDVSFWVKWPPDLNSAGGHGVSNGLLLDYSEGTVRNWKVKWNDASDTTFAFAGVITSMSTAAPIDGVLSADLTIKITSKPTLA